MGFKVAGYVDEETPQGEYRGIMILGKVEDLPKLITQNGILEILIALKKEQEELIEKVIEICGQCGLNIKIVPEMYQVIYGQVRTQSVYGMPLIEVFPQLMKPLERFLKRIMDIVVSMLILVISLPVSLVIMLVIKLESPGPIIYSQKRVGKEGKEFTIYKFRSMVQDAEKHTGAKWAEKNDPRVTRIGGFLRRTHLDEIPQFFNVMIGNMSLVGPRPERKFFVEQFVKQIPLYSRRHNVKPGLTSFAQLQGIYDSSLETVKTRLSFDMQYINSMSFALDIKILWQTVFLMLKGTGR
jgi:exopolysaccharide biosynthesis polyprenyl glycosylphosphotransferase